MFDFQCAYVNGAAVDSPVTDGVYICKVRPLIQDNGSTRPMIHHGLRHSYAVRTWQELIEGGMSQINASLRVSQLLGHERPDVTDIYLASLKKEAF